MNKSVVFLNRFYWPDHAATAQLLHDLTVHLAERGWDVSVIAAAAGYAGAGRSRDVEVALRETHAGVKIERTRAVKADRKTTGGSLGEYASYTAGALQRLAVNRASIVVAMSDPPLLAAAALPLARLKRKRLVHWVQDIHPDVASRVGALPRDGAAISALRSLARMTYRNADLTVTIGPVMAAHIAAEGTPSSRLRVIPNWVDTSAVKPIDATENRLIGELGLDGKFVVLYSGNAARSHPLDAVLGAMKTLRDRDDIFFLFIGSGVGHDEMKREAESAGLVNCRFLPSLPRERIAESHSLAAACLVSESPDVAGLLFPSKSIGILASERPLLFLGSKQSEVARLVTEYDCGINLDTHDAEGLVRAIEALRSNPDRAHALGQNGRAAAVNHFDAKICCAAWEDALTALIARG